MQGGLLIENYKNAIIRDNLSFFNGLGVFLFMKSNKFNSSSNNLGDVWKRLAEFERSLKRIESSLLDEINSKATDDEKIAKQASKMTSEYRNRALEAKDTAETTLNEIQGIKEKGISIKEEMANFKEASSLLKDNSNQEYLSCQKIHESLSELHENTVAETSKYSIEIQSNAEKASSLLVNIEEDINSLRTVIDENSSIQDDIEEYRSKVNEAESNLKKIKDQLSTAISTTKDLTSLYDEVFGYEHTDDETEESYFVDGLKGQLDKAYSELETSLSNIKKDIVEFKENIENDFESSHETYQNQLNELIDKQAEQYNDWVEDKDTSYQTELGKHIKEYESLKQKVKSLLPGALTAGLSYAYTNKKDEELQALAGYNRSFNYALLGLLFVSFIPFAINAYLVTLGDPLREVIGKTPELVLSILPIYTPFLWLAYSSGKKANLSKRLIEEYTHKEVLNKTVEGLSQQIESLDNDTVSSELRVKLLYNILETSSENPGKLISDYNTSDHPLMDALEKSSKLTKSINSLSKVPGLGQIVKMMESKKDELLAKESKDIEASLNGFNVNEKEKDESCSETNKNKLDA